MWYLDSNFSKERTALIWTFWRLTLTFLRSFEPCEFCYGVLQRLIPEEANSHQHPRENRKADTEKKTGDGHRLESN
jgi:hypothetical protein